MERPITVDKFAIECIILLICRTGNFSDKQLLLTVSTSEPTLHTYEQQTTRIQSVCNCQHECWKTGIVLHQEKTEGGDGIADGGLLDTPGRCSRLQFQCNYLSSGLPAGLHLQPSSQRHNHVDDLHSLHRTGLRVLHILLLSWVSWLSHDPGSTSILIICPTIGYFRHIFKSSSAEDDLFAVNELSGFLQTSTLYSCPPLSTDLKRSLNQFSRAEVSVLFNIHSYEVIIYYSPFSL